MSRATAISRAWEVARYFTRLGFTAFGGPAAHVAMMEEELVHRRQWLDRQHFLDLLAAINFIPGPNSTELAIALGYHRAGWRGLLAAGFCFITPAVLIILPIGWLYVTYHSKPAVGGVLRGISAAVVAIVAVAVLRFARTAIKDRFGAGIAVVAIFADLIVHHLAIPAGDIAIMAIAAVGGSIWRGPPPARKKLNVILGLPILSTVGAAVATFTQPALMAALFVKIGLTLFGSGYLLLPYLQSSFVDQRHWLNQQQLLDAVAVGQVTPGPLLTTATFIGFVLGDQWMPGRIGYATACAILATAAIFAPSFGLIAIVSPFLDKLRKSPRARASLDGMNAAVVALIAVTCITIGRQAIASPRPMVSAIIIAGSFAILYPTKINSTWILAIAAVLGWIFLAG